MHATNSVIGLRSEYTLRRDFVIDCIAEQFRITPGFVMHGSTESGMWGGKWRAEKESVESLWRTSDRTGQEGVDVIVTVWEGV